jgi:hypothetical protein
MKVGASFASGLESGGRGNIVSGRENGGYALKTYVVYISIK